MQIILTAILITCFGHIWAGQFEFKYNIVGPIIPRYSEHGFEAEYFHTKILIPFTRISLLARDYEDHDWSGEAVGGNIETGFQIWVGNKAKPFTWRFMRNLEVLLFYRQSHSEFEHVNLGWAADFEHVFGGDTKAGKEKVGAKAIGTGLSFNINVGERFIVEPFWYGDYGRYDIERISKNTNPYSPYQYRWDVEQRVGLNFGYKL